MRLQGMHSKDARKYGSRAVPRQRAVSPTGRNRMSTNYQIERQRLDLAHHLATAAREAFAALIARTGGGGAS